MLDPSLYTKVVRTMADVPPRAVAAVKPGVATGLGGSVAEMFPDFARSFPLTVTSMAQHWSKPALALKDMGRGWLATLFVEQEALNLFFDDPFPVYADEPYFDTSMLPERWVALYRSMSSFTITDKSYYSPVGWHNTPLPRGMDLDQFSTETQTKKQKLKAFEDQLGVDAPSRLCCWMITDARDSLWIDAQHCDRKVHHVRGEDFPGAYTLQDPGATLDRYLAHIVAGGKPAAFDFRDER